MVVVDARDWWWWPAWGGVLVGGGDVFVGGGDVFAGVVVPVDSPLEGGGDATDVDGSVVEGLVEDGGGVSAESLDVFEVGGEEGECGVAGEVAGEVLELGPPGGDVGHARARESVVELVLVRAHARQAITLVVGTRS